MAGSPLQPLLSTVERADLAHADALVPTEVCFGEDSSAPNAEQLQDVRQVCIPSLPQIAPLLLTVVHVSSHPSACCTCLKPQVASEGGGQHPCACWRLPLISCCRRKFEGMFDELLSAPESICCIQAAQGDDYFNASASAAGCDVHSLQGFAHGAARPCHGTPRDIMWRMQIVQESNALKSQARDQDEADPFARLHPGRRLFLPSLAQEESESAQGRTQQG